MINHLGDEVVKPSSSIDERGGDHRGHVTIFRENFALNPGQEIAIELNSIQALK